MSQIHRVILLNKPLKIFDFTPVQLGLFVLSILFALLVCPKIPGVVPGTHLPLNILTGIGIICLSIVCVKATELRPGIWWRNLLFYRLGMIPKVYMPHEDPGSIYPDPTIIDAPKKSDRYHVTADNDYD